MQLAERYPAELVASQRDDVRRIAFNIELVTSRVGSSVSLCDIGGGIGLFSPGCAAMGMQSTLVDDFEDDVNYQTGRGGLSVHRELQVQVVSRDVVRDGLTFPAESFDVVTTFDSMEHWHHSPKKLFAQVMTILKPGGLFVLGVPNCVNLRKRIAVPLGRSKWSSMDDWYEKPVFRAHVREPDIDDLRYIARDMKLEKFDVLGANWLGHANTRPWIKSLVKVVDPLLRPFPGLCSDIYLVGFKARR